MSAAETVPKVRIWPRSDASRAPVKFENNLSAKDIISRHIRNQTGVYLFDNPPLNFQRAFTADFVDLLYFPGGHLRSAF